MGSRTSCRTSMHLSHAECCEAPGGRVFERTCWDGVFSSARCCDKTGPLLTSPKGDPSCWVAGYSFERCCSESSGDQCWDDQGFFTFNRCCVGRSVARQGGLDVNFSMLEEITHQGRCTLPVDAERCGDLWRFNFPTAELRADTRIQFAAIHLARSWRRSRSLQSMAIAAPAFTISVALTAALALIDHWVGQAQKYSEVWAEVADYVSINRKFIHKVRTIDLSALHIIVLDLTLAQRVHLHYPDVLMSVLAHRIHDSDQWQPDFGNRLSHSFMIAFQELVEVLEHLKIDYVPIQGTLISLLRYGSFPTGRLSEGKIDVVDNDAEVMLLLDSDADLNAVFRRISLALETNMWPPCIYPHFQKFVCFSLRHAIPCKLEIYVAWKDADRGVVVWDKDCATSEPCQHSNRFPLQYWAGRLPINTIYPLGRCRVGDRQTHCPHLPLDFLHGWNKGEYGQQLISPPSSIVGGIMGASQASCLAYPVLSADRDEFDARNTDLQLKGLTLEDLRLLHSYARTLHARGFACFHVHLRENPCVMRHGLISQGKHHAGLSQLGKGPK